MNYSHSRKGQRPVCCFCGRKLHRWPGDFALPGHNAWPLDEGGRCCKHCDETIVIPERQADLPRPVMKYDWSSRRVSRSDFTLVETPSGFVLKPVVKR